MVNQPANYRHRTSGVCVTAVRLNGHELRWPTCVEEWPDERYWQPADGSHGYIDTHCGRLHVWHGDWIILVDSRIGMAYTMSDERFRESFEEVV
jgi:hypothetical protein